MASDPLVVADVKQFGEAGRHVMVHCPEPGPCMDGRLHGCSAVVAEALTRLEAIHQAAHALREES